MSTRALPLVVAAAAWLVACNVNNFGPPAPDTGIVDVASPTDADAGDVTRSELGADTLAPPIGHCSIDMELDRTCPTKRTVCGTFMDGGDGCVLEGGRGGCYFDGVKAYRVTPGSPVGLTFGGSVLSLQLLFANETLSSGTIAFFDADDQLVTAMTTNGDCLTNMLPRQFIQFARPVRKATATATGGPVWIDAVEINP